MNKYKFVFFLIFYISITFFLGACSEIQKWLYPEEETAISDNGKFSEFFKENKEVIISELKIPENIRVSEAEYGNAIVISWKDVEYANYYNLYRKRADGNEYTLITQVLQGQQTYTDSFETSSLPLDDLYADYDYRVEAVSNNGALSPQSPPKRGYLLVPPQAGEGTKSGLDITITWSVARGARGYKVYRSTDKDLFGTLLPYQFSQNARTFTDTEDLKFGVKYYYFVVSQSGSGESSIPVSKHPNILGLRVRPDAPKPTPVIASKGTSRSSVAVRWEVVTATGGGDITYNIFKSSSESSRLAEVALNVEAEDLSKVDKDGKNYLQFTDADRDGLKKYIAYTYFVQPLETKSGEVVQGGYSPNPDSDLKYEAQPQTGYILSPPNPKYIAARRIDSHVELTWQKALSAIRYFIYVSSVVTGPYNLLADINASGEGPFAYRHEGAGSGSVFYKITSTGLDEENVELSTVLASSDPVETLPGIVKNVQASDNKYFANIQTNANDVYPIKITWSSAQDTGAKSYSVFRASSTKSLSPPDDEKYTQIASGITNLFYYDNANVMRPKQYFYYKVQAHNSLGGGGDLSNRDRGYGAISNLTFVDEFQKVVKKSHNTLPKLKSASLGTDNANGAFSGTVKYSAEVVGVGGKGSVVYNNYASDSDSENKNTGYLIINGRNDTNVNSSATGTQTASYTISGMYSGKITANLKISSGAASGGFFTAIQNSGVPQGNVSPGDVTVP